MTASSLHPWFILGLYLTTLALVWRRGVFFRIFVALFFGVMGLIWWGLFSHLEDVDIGIAMLLEAMTALHFVRLVDGRLRSPTYRALLSIPASWFAASTLLAFPFGIAAGFGVTSYAFMAAFVVGGFGVFQSLDGQPEMVRLVLDRTDRGKLAPCPREARSLEHVGRTRKIEDDAFLRIVQITDPHLGAFMSPERLAAICQQAVAADPDLVVITGDLLTMEAHGDVDAITRSFAPLSVLPGRVFACFGNHDHEDRESVRTALANVGVQLLVDEWVRHPTRLGPIDIIGADFHFRNRQQKLEALFDGHDDDGTPRLLLLHHPGHIEHIPEGATDLTLCGHTHGGHIGLLSLGLDWTVVRAFTSIPDHGLWARGRDRVYVHRGTGHYGFPLRVGVPREESLLQVYLPRLARPRTK